VAQSFTKAENFNEQPIEESKSDNKGEPVYVDMKNNKNKAFSDQAQLSKRIADQLDQLSGDRINKILEDI